MDWVFISSLCLVTLDLTYLYRTKTSKDDAIIIYLCVSSSSSSPPQLPHWHLTHCVTQTHLYRPYRIISSYPIHFARCKAQRALFVAPTHNLPPTTFSPRGRFGSKVRHSLSHLVDGSKENFARASFFYLTLCGTVAFHVLSSSS